MSFGMEFQSFAPSYIVNYPVNFPCGRKLDYPEETHGFQQRVDLLLFGVGSSHIEKRGPESQYYLITSALIISI